MGIAALTRIHYDAGGSTALETIVVLAKLDESIATGVACFREDAKDSV